MAHHTHVRVRFNLVVFVVTLRCVASRVRAVDRRSMGDADGGETYTYVDLSGTTQGPFDAHAIAQWFHAGYLEASQPLTCTSNGTHTTVGEVCGKGTPAAEAEVGVGMETGELMHDDDEDADVDGDVEARAKQPARLDDAREEQTKTALDERLTRLLEVGGGTMPSIQLGDGVAGLSLPGFGGGRTIGGGEDHEEEEGDAGGEEHEGASKRLHETLGVSLSAEDMHLEKYKRPSTWRDILSATREKVRKGRASQGPPPDESRFKTNDAWSLDVNESLKDPRPDLSKLDAEVDEEGALPEEPEPIDLREPFWVLEDRATTDGGFDAEGLNAAVAEQLRNANKPPTTGDARSDRSDVSWSVKPGGLERRDALAAERRANEAKSRAAATSKYKAKAATLDRNDDEESARKRQLDAEAAAAAQQRRDMLAFFAVNPYAGQWWLPDDAQGGAPTLGPFMYDELLAKLPHVMVAHRREDDTWRVVGPYAARDRVENYGRAAHGAVVSAAGDNAEEADKIEREMEVEAWFDAATLVIDVDEDVKDAFPKEVSPRDADDVETWFDAAMAKVGAPGDSKKSSVAKKSSRKRGRSRGFEMRVVADEQQNARTARLLGDVYQAIFKNRKRLFASIVEPVLDDWLCEAE